MFLWVTSEQTDDFDADVDTKYYSYGEYSLCTETHKLRKLSGKRATTLFSSCKWHPKFKVSTFFV